MAGQLVAFNISYGYMIVSFHLHFDFAADFTKIAPYFIIFLFVNIVIINDISVAYKDIILKKIKIKK